MPFETFPTYPPVNAELVDRIVSKLKSQGIFDQFRKDCLADVDTKEVPHAPQDPSVCLVKIMFGWYRDGKPNPVPKYDRRYLRNLNN